MQRYKCFDCRLQFQSDRRPDKSNGRLWCEYAWKKQNLSELAETNGRSSWWVKKRLDEVEIQALQVTPRPVVIITDTTFWGRSYGVTVFRIPEERNIWWQEVDRELMVHYRYGRKILEDRGWTFTAAVVDGRRGLTNVFKDKPVQICQFHQMQTVTKYLTRRPETLAGIDLRVIVL